MNEGNKPHRNTFQESMKNKTIPIEWRTPAKFMAAGILAYGVYYYFSKSKTNKPITVVTDTGNVANVYPKNARNEGNK